jgi:pterin-4a-carbinolamine dehydratase
MPNAIFLSYRRSDSQHATLGIADRLRWSFGVDEVFLDRGSIEAGLEWSQVIQQALAQAKVVVVIIGPGWLRSADVWGRRRLDDSRDWVRREICAALAGHAARERTVIPVYLDDAVTPPSEALDLALQPLLALQKHVLRSDHWEAGLRELLDRIGEVSKLPQRPPPDGERNPNGSPARPLPKQTQWPTLSDEEARSALQKLGGWQLQWSDHPWGTGGRAQEIAKTYEFGSFRQAVDFMHRTSQKIQEWKPPHHPRWENQWKVVTVSFTTWDVNCRLTKLDLDAARKMDGLYHEART